MADAFVTLVNHGDGVIDAHAVGAGMLLHQCGDGIVGFLAGPVALPFEQDLLPGHRDDAGLDHAVHGVFVRIGRGAAGGVGNHVDLVVGVMHARQREGGVADFGPQPGDDDFLAAVGGIFGQRIADVLIVPGIHRGTFENVVFREDGEQFGIGVAGEGLCFDGGDGRWNVEDLCRLGETDDVVLQHLPIDRLNAEGHLRLLVDEDQLAVLGGQDFEFAGHGLSPL
ncbi:hypothetical protein D9M68_756190 [compost metagenome]